MNIGSVKVDAIKDLASNITLTVQIVGLSRWKGRLWVARQLFKLAARIACLNIKFEDKPYSGADL